jgi:TonB family protein
MNGWTDPLAGIWLGAVDHLWQTTLVLAVLLLLDRWLRRAPAALRADLWTLGLIKLALPAAAGGAFVSWLAGRFDGDVPAVGALVAGVLAPAPATASVGASVWAPVLLAITAVWAIGFVYAAIRLMDDLRRQSRFARHARPATDRALIEAADRAGIPRAAIVVAPGVSLPLVQGWWRPRILMPPHLARLLPPVELEALLRHEERHRRRRDPLRQLMGRMLVTVFWFFPPLRWLIARLNECSEYACDEAALAAGVDADVYLRALARAIRRGLDPAPPVAAAASGGPQLLRRRLARLREKERLTMKHGRLVLTAAALLVSAAFFLPLDLVADEVPPPPPPRAEPAPDPVPEPAPAPEKEPAPVAAPEPVAPPAKVKAERMVDGDTPPPPPKKKVSKKEIEAEKQIVDKKKQLQARKEAGEDLVVAPELVKFVEPQYPEAAKREGIEGVVELIFLVDEKGKPMKVKVARGIEGRREFADAAIKALKQCEFKPGTINGKPARVKTTLKMKFEVE